MDTEINLILHIFSNLNIFYYFESLKKRVCSDCEKIILRKTLDFRPRNLGQYSPSVRRKSFHVSVTRGDVFV